MLRAIALVTLVLASIRASADTTAMLANRSTALLPSWIRSRL